MTRIHDNDAAMYEDSALAGTDHDTRHRQHGDIFGVPTLFPEWDWSETVTTLLIIGLLAWLFLPGLFTVHVVSEAQYPGGVVPTPVPISRPLEPEPLPPSALAHNMAGFPMTFEETVSHAR